MFVKKNKGHNGRVFLTLTQGYYVNGKTKHKTIENLGYLDDLEKLYDDPITHFKEIAKQRTLENIENTEVIFTVSGNEKLSPNTNNRMNLGYSILKNIYCQLDLPSFLQKKQRGINAEFNLNSIFSLLIFNRILTPSSIKKAFESKDTYFEGFNFSLDDMYRSLDYFNAYSRELQKHLNERVTQLCGRNQELAYYDVTNYYFEIPYNDKDEVNDNNQVIKPGLRKKGFSKENRKDPIVQMGLLMDNQGLPIAYNIFPGNESEKTSLRPSVRQIKTDNDIKRIVVVADRGINTSDNMYFLAGKNDYDNKKKDGYVYGQSVLGADNEFKEYVLKQDDYVVDIEKDKHNKDIQFKHKSRIFAKTIKIKKDGKRTVSCVIYQKQMVYYSQKYADKKRKEREVVIAKAKDLINNPTKYNQATSYGAAKYINNIKFIKKTGEIAQGLDLSIDIDKILEEEKYDGYYSIVTSEMELKNKEIRDIYKGLWEIEESFKIMKSEFKSRPVYLTTEEHIQAHFLICFVSLVIFRVLELKLNNKYSVKQIRHSLLSYSCSQAHENYYLFDYRDEVLEKIEKIFDVDFSHKYMKRSQIKKILQNS